MTNWHVVLQKRDQFEMFIAARVSEGLKRRTPHPYSIPSLTTTSERGRDATTMSEQGQDAQGRAMNLRL